MEFRITISLLARYRMFEADSLISISIYDGTSLSRGSSWRKKSRFIVGGIIIHFKREHSEINLKLTHDYFPITPLYSYFYLRLLQSRLH